MTYARKHGKIGMFSGWHIEGWLRRMADENKTAYIYNEGRYTKIRIKDRVLTIIAPYSLERYISVKKWDYGYLEVMTKYAHSEEPIEEYIDLLPILDELYMDPEETLDGVDRLEVCYKSSIEWVLEYENKL